MFKCDCGRSFGSKPELNQHKLTHCRDRTKFSCTFCSSTYSRKANLDLHMHVYHSNVREKFRCDECKYEGKTKDHLKRHQRIHQKQFKCNKCDKRFSRNKYLKNHKKKHDEPDEFVCLCSRVFKSSKAFKYHRTMMHKAGEPIEIDDGTYTCYFCYKIFSSKKYLKTHMKTHEEKKKCPICFKMFTVLSLEIHIRHHQLKKEGKFQCQKCSKAFLTSQYLKDHMKYHDDKLNQQHNNEQMQEKSDSIAEDQDKLKVKKIRRSRKSLKTFICDLCGKTYEKKKRLTRHLFMHIKPFKCDCGKNFGSKPHLNEHKSTHDKDRKRFSCIFCSSTHSTKRSLDRHIKTYHFTIGEKFKCDKCDYEGKTKNLLKDHQRIHQKSFNCNKCDKRFSTNQILKNHLKKHDELDEFVCLCSRVFKSSGALNVHKAKMHVASEPIEIDDGTYTCNICQKIFGSKKILKRHMKTHEEKKKCPICFKMFTVRYLKIHVRQHQLKEEGKFKCQKCSKTFLTSQYLKQHFKLHDKQFECDFCGHRVASKNEIKNHTKRHINSI